MSAGASCWVIVPVKPVAQAKQRLAGALSPERRAALTRLMQGHVLNTIATASHVARLCVVGQADMPLPAGTVALCDPGNGLNAALSSALAAAARHGANRTVVIVADLPLLASNDVELLCAAAYDSIAIAPDRHGTGTNALSLPLPAARGFTFAFGPDSFALHGAEAARLGLTLEQIHSPGLARDVDEPSDLADAAGLTG